MEKEDEEDKNKIKKKRLIDPEEPQKRFLITLDKEGIVKKLEEK